MLTFWIGPTEGEAPINQTKKLHLDCFHSFHDFMFILLKYTFYFNLTNKKKNTNIITKEKITKSHADCYTNVNLKKKKHNTAFFI